MNFLRNNKKKKEQLTQTDKLPIRKTIQSTQQNLPIKGFVDGIVITKSNEYVKIMEILPSPYFLKPDEEKAKIISRFTQLLKTSPVEMQFKSVSLPASLTKQLNYLEENRSTETNKKCLSLDDDYEITLKSAENYGVKMRFFIIFKYEDEGSLLGKKGSKLERATKQLNNIYNRLKQKLEDCGNEVISLDYDNLNEANAEIFYTLLNRDKFQKEPFKEHFESIIKKYFDHFGDQKFFVPATEYISPDRINFTNTRYTVINNTYYRWLFIPRQGYNSIVYPGWMDLLISSGKGVDVDIFVRKIPATKIMGKLKRSIGHATADTYGAGYDIDTLDAASGTLNAGLFIKDGISSGLDFYYVSTLITVTGSTMEEVDETVERIIKNSAENDIKVMELLSQNEDAFRATLPLCDLPNSIYEKSKRNMLTDGVASCYPFLVYEMMHEKGIYFGADKDTGSLVIVDIFNRKLFPNSNMFISGTTGAGKTFSLLLMALRLRIAHTQVMILAPEKEDEFKRVVDAIGGTFISLGVGSTNRINIMDIYPKDESAQDDEALLNKSANQASYLMEKQSTLITFIQLLYTSLDKNFTEKQKLGEAIIKTYNRFGITVDNESIWNEDHTGYKKMPILSDLLEEVEKMDGMNNIIDILKYLTSGHASFFNGRTNIDLNNEFIVFGLEHNTDELMPLSIFTAMEYCWSKIKENRTKRKMLFIDEWWKMAFNPIAANYSMEIAKLTRAYYSGVCYATQQMSDILAAGDYGKAVIGNCSINIIMKSKKSDIAAMSELVSLTETEHKRLETFNRGDALFIADSNRMIINFIASSSEFDLISTDSETILRLVEEEKIKKKAKEFNKMLEEAPDIDDLFINTSDIEDRFIQGDDLFVSSKELKNTVKGEAE